MAAQFHEDFSRKNGEPRASERSFGLVFAVVFALIGLAPLLDNGSARLWAIVAATTFGALALTVPRSLAPLNRMWTALGKLLHRIVSPLVLGVLFLVAVVPTSMYLRLTGSDPLRLKRDPSAKTYWLCRNPPGPNPASFKNQF